MESLEQELETQEIMEKDINPIVAHAESIVIKSDDDCSQATNFVKQIKLKKQEIDNILGLKAQTKSAHTAWKFAKEREKQFLEPFDNAESAIKAKIKKYETKRIIEQNRLAAEEAEKKRKLEEEGKKPFVSPMPEDVPIKRSGEHTKKLVWKARPLSIKELCESIISGDLPENVIDVNLPNLNRFAKTVEGSKSIKGVEFYQEADIRIR